MTDLRSTDIASAVPARTFWGHPRGLMTLFFTEMWERLSYYGMRSILILFLVDATRGGFGLDDKTVAAIYGLYTAGVYLVALPGGWIADRLLGAQRAIWWGSAVIMLGHILLAFGTVPSVFYLGLVTIVVGTGLLKPNIAAVIADLYPEGGGRRDAGYTLFYMGINVGGLLGPLVVAGLAEAYGWHVGFAAAAVGMGVGLVQFRLTRGALQGVGLQPSAKHRFDERDKTQSILRWLGVAALTMLVLLFARLLPFDPVFVARNTAWMIVSTAIAFFVYLALFAGFDVVARRRIWVVVALFVASSLFWAGFEQAGSSFNLFAERFTDRMIDAWRFEVPAGWFQSANSLFILIFAPLFAVLWSALAKHNRDLSAPAKLGWGLLLVGAGFLVMAKASTYVAGGDKVLPSWLITVYLLHTFGELCLSPVGMSAVTKLAPRRFVGQMMGIWYVSLSLGSLLAGLIAGEFDATRLAAMPGQYFAIAWLVVLPGVLLLLLGPLLKKASGGVS